MLCVCDWGYVLMVRFSQKPEALIASKVELHTGVCSFMQVMKIKLQSFVRSILAVSHRTISWRYNLNKLCTMFIYFLFNKKARITVNTLFFITILWMDNALFHLQTSTNKTLDQALNVSVYLKLQSKLYPVVYGSFRIMLRFSKSHGEYM